MKFELPQLPYSYAALEPFIDARTMEMHHAKHHQTYVTKLNDALAKYPSFAEASAVTNVLADKSEGKAELEALEVLLKDLNSVPEDIRGSVRNHGGGHFNHSLFWHSCLSITYLKKSASIKVSLCMQQFFSCSYLIFSNNYRSPMWM